MQEVKFTKGIWKIQRSRVGRSVFSIGPLTSDEYGGLSWLEVSDEDANLISAAPELYEALEDAVSQIRSHLILLKCDNEFIDKQTAMARAALSKARGEQ